MGDQPGQKMWTVSDRGQLSGLMDKIVAVQLDLKPLCNASGDRASPLRLEMTISAACEILQSAIEDLRGVIQRLENLPAK